MPGRIAVAGSLAQRPGQGGHTWVLLQYLLGFRRLGWDVLFIDRLGPGMCGGERRTRAGIERSRHVRYFLRWLTRFGLDEAFSLEWNGGERYLGLSRSRLLEWVRGSDLLLNVMGFLTDEEVLSAAPRRVFLDIDPGFGQMWRALDLADLFQGHDVYVTIAQNIGKPRCTIPTCGIPWIVTRQPIVLEHWPVSDGAFEAGFTSIGAWRGPYDPIAYEGRVYGLRVHEFRRFVTLPRLSGATFRMALDIDEADAPDLIRLRKNGWRLVDPTAAAGDPWVYRDFIQNSGAEFMVAKNIYVDTHSGWFSDRSICYLASGKPVLAQDTGLADSLPLGDGLLTFSTLEEALSGIDRLATDPGRHGQAARELAEECFDSDRVLGRLTDEIGRNDPGVGTSGSEGAEEEDDDILRDARAETSCR